MNRHLCISKDAHRGQALLTVVIFVLLIGMAGIGGFSSIALRETGSARSTLLGEQSLYLSEAGMEDVVYRVKNGKQYGTSETLTLNGQTATTTITGTGLSKTILAEGNVLHGIRREQMTLSSAGGASFVYGVQVGRGGVSMENSSSIIGSIYSNGDIVGNGNSAITGDAFAATTHIIDNMTIGGSGYAHLITNSTIEKNASSTTDLYDVAVGAHGHADRIIRSTIGKNAYYTTSISGSTVGGVAYPGTPPPTELSELPLPIPDITLDAWETDAASGGVISSPCPYKPADGTVIGPKKINCDMEVDGSKVITLTGTVWISGNLKLKNSAQIKLHSSFGNTSGVIIIDNPENRLTSSKVTIENSAQILGSGASGSYTLVASRNASAENGGLEEAFEIKNSSSAALYYAPHGFIEIHNTGAIKEATAYKLTIKNNATVTYETGLSDILFSSGPTGGYSIKTWQEVQ